MPQNNIREFLLVGKKDEAEDIVSLFLKPTDNSAYPFLAGQYVNITLPSIHAVKSYTISSAPGEIPIRLTIKRKGISSLTLVGLPIGEKLMLEGPYGHFYPESGRGDLVFVAGGIGITPFLSIINDRLKPKSKVKMSLFYSNKTIKGTAFFDELNKKAENKDIELVYFLTGEKTNHPFIREFSRINGGAIKKYLEEPEKKSYYLCGSIEFVNDMWKMLRNQNISEENIFTESFY